VRYEYPKEADYIIRDVVPLLEAANVQRCSTAHHICGTVLLSGTHFLETSNVGNLRCRYGDNKREVPAGYEEDYVANGDPNGLSRQCRQSFAERRAALPLLRVTTSRFSVS